MKLFILDRFSLMTIGLIGFFGLFLTLGEPAVTETAAGESHLLPIYSVETDKKEVPLTFDVAWEPTDTDEVLSVLRENNVKATFFLVGDWISKYPEEVKKIVDEGHELGTHSMNHDAYSAMSEEQLLSDMDAVDALLSPFTGKEKHLVRAPSGDYTDAVTATVRASGRELIQWDTDSLDWKGLTPAEMETRVFERMESGSILLFHLGCDNTAEALGRILPRAKSEGYSFSKVGDFIYSAPFTIDHTGRQRQAEEQ